MYMSTTMLLIRYFNFTLLIRFRYCSALEWNEILDEDGVLYVGAMAGPSDTLECVLQDLRIYSRHLHEGYRLYDQFLVPRPPP